MSKKRKEIRQQQRKAWDAEKGRRKKGAGQESGQEGRRRGQERGDEGGQDRRQGRFGADRERVGEGGERVSGFVRRPELAFAACFW